MPTNTAKGRTASKVTTCAPMNASGLRITHTSRWFRLDQLLGVEESLTLGRTHQRGIRLNEYGISRLHCNVTRTGIDEYTIEDCGSKNGVWISRCYGQMSYQRVERVPLEVGMYIRLGILTMVAVDADGATPILARRYSEFVVRAYEAYGSAEETSRRIGRRSPSVIRKLANSVKESLAS